MKLGAIDWGEGYSGFQFKLGYCKCGEKVLATGDELTEIVEAFNYLERRKRPIKLLVEFLLKKLV